MQPDSTEAQTTDTVGVAADPAAAMVQLQIRRALFAARWVMAPVYFGLLAAMALIVTKFVLKLITAFNSVLREDGTDTMLNVLSLVDMALVGNLIMMVVMAGWENSINRLGERPQAGWASTLGFSALKQKIIGSVVVIAAVAMLETFMYLKEVPAQHVFWQVCILLALGVSSVLLAVSDKLSGDKH